MGNLPFVFLPAQQFLPFRPPPSVDLGAWIHVVVVTPRCLPIFVGPPRHPRFWILLNLTISVAPPVFLRLKRICCCSYHFLLLKKSASQVTDFCRWSKYVRMRQTFFMCDRLLSPALCICSSAIDLQQLQSHSFTVYCPLVLLIFSICSLPLTRVLLQLPCPIPSLCCLFVLIPCFCPFTNRAHTIAGDGWVWKPIPQGTLVCLK